MPRHQLTREQLDAVADAQSRLSAAYVEILRAITAMNAALSPVLYAPVDNDTAADPPPPTPAP